jgi:1,6-anhydro-N-acetylmuramate kinase
VVVGGGGSHNKFLMERLEANLKLHYGLNTTLTTHESIGFDRCGYQFHLRM